MGMILSRRPGRLVLTSYLVLPRIWIVAASISSFVRGVGLSISAWRRHTSLVVPCSVVYSDSPSALYVRLLNEAKPHLLLKCASKSCGGRCTRHWSYRYDNSQPIVGT